MFLSRWHYSTSFWVVFPELPLVVFENLHFPSSIVSVQGVAPCPHNCFLCPWGHWCLAVAGVTSVAGITTRSTGMAELLLCLGLLRLQPLLPQWGKLEGGVEAGVRGCQVYGPHHHKQGSGVSCAPVAKRTGVIGLTSTAAQFSVAMGTAAVGSQSHVCHLHCCYWILWGCGSPMIVRRPVSGALVLPPLCVPTHPPSDYRCVDLSCVLVC